jgi:AGCS family alanine or glycine:cation symporter
MGLVWDTADLLQGTMVIIHIPVIMILVGTAVKALKDYLAQKKNGTDPEFTSASIGIAEELDFWK